ncbi:MAG: hypothetical protein QY304_03195 [Candidatus Paceibacterota bacterium]|nr:MAG: hypothetical protein QY304_03195 [Candidatus Paceibacterota bacterium]
MFAPHTNKQKEVRRAQDKYSWRCDPEISYNNLEELPGDLCGGSRTCSMVWGICLHDDVTTFRSP